MKFLSSLLPIIAQGFKRLLTDDESPSLVGIIILLLIVLIVLVSQDIVVHVNTLVSV